MYLQSTSWLLAITSRKQMIVRTEGLLFYSNSLQKVWYQGSYKPSPGIDIPKYNLTIYKDYAYQHLHEARYAYHSIHLCWLSKLLKSYLHPLR